MTLLPLTLAVSVTALSSAAAGGSARQLVAPPPLFQQCDSRWGQYEMGAVGRGERSTICGEGCAMSCVAMALAGAGFALPATHAPIDPGSLNTWLLANNGYHCDAGDCNNLVLTAPDAVTGGRMRLIGEWNASDLNLAKDFAADLDVVFIAHVHNPEIPSHPVDHFVLLDSFDQAADRFGVRDPFFNETTYALAEIADVLQYEVVSQVKCMHAITSSRITTTWFTRMFLRGCIWVQLPVHSLVPEAYPLYKQCDPRWAEDVIGIDAPPTDRKTVCAVGCLMSSTSMVLAQRGILIDGQPSTPGSLNAWLRANGG